MYFFFVFTTKNCIFKVAQKCTRVPNCCLLICQTVSFSKRTADIFQIFKMTSPLRLQIILGEDDARKLILPAGTPVSIEDLCHTVKTSFGLQQDIQLQYQDEDFGNEFMNMSDVSEVKDKGTLKVIFLQSPQEEDARTSQSQATESVSISSADTDDTEPISSSGSSPSSRHWAWPSVFTVPQFRYEAEFELEKANTACANGGTLLNPSPKLKSQILERLAEEIYKFKAYPTDNDLTDVAEALVKKHPCLTEQGSFNGCYGWKISLKYKMANLRTKLRGLGCTEVTINSIKNKSGDNRQAAFNVKKPKRAEVNYCPQYPKGETSESLEQERVAILSELTKRNNDSVVSVKMEKTFSYRRQEVLQGQPMVADFKSRWPALFTAREASVVKMHLDVACNLCFVVQN